jgi:PilZ domain.
MKPADEKRRYRRYRHRLEALVVIDDGRTHVPAQVLDASAFGARIRLGEDVDLPDEFRMLFMRRIEQCRVVWRDRRTFGLVYQD